MAYRISLENSIILPAWDHDVFAQNLMSKIPNHPSYKDLIKLLYFSDGDISVQIKESMLGYIKNKDVYVVCSPRSGDSSEIRKSLLYKMFKITGKAAKDNGAKHVYGIMSEHLMDRLHRSKSGEPLTGEAIAKEIHAHGFEKILTLAIHSDDWYDFYKKAYRTKEGGEILHSIDPSIIEAHLFLNILHENNLFDKEIVMIGVDAGAERWIKRFNRYAEGEIEKRSGKKIKYIYLKKVRKNPNDPKSTVSVIDWDKTSKEIKTLEDTICVVIDDKIDRGGSVNNSIYTIYKEEKIDGTPSYLFGIYPHGLINTPAPKILKILGMNCICSTSNPTRRTKQEIRDLPIFWYDATDLFWTAIPKCLKGGKHPDEVFIPENDPLWTAYRYYKIVQKPKELVECTGDAIPAKYI